MASACMLNCFSHVWFFVTLCTVASQAPLSLGFSRQEYWGGLPCPPPGALPDPEIESMSPVSCIDRLGSLPLVPLEKPFVIRVPLYIHFFFFPTLVSFLYLLVPSSHWSVWLTLHCGPDYPKEVLKSFKLQFQLLVTISLWFKDIIGYIMYHHIIYFYTENHLLFFSDFKLFILYWGIAN